MPQSDGLSPEDTIVQDIMADPNIPQIYCKQPLTL